MATHSSILTWRIPWTQEAGRLQSMGSQGVRQNWRDLAHTHTRTHTHTYKNSPDKNTGVGSHSLLQGIFPTQRLNQDLLHCRPILYCLSHQGSPIYIRICIIYILIHTYNIYIHIYIYIYGFPGGTVVKNPPTNEGDARGMGLIPGSGRSSGVGNGNPLQLFLSGKFHRQRSLAG